MDGKGKVDCMQLGSLEEAYLVLPQMPLTLLKILAKLGNKKISSPKGGPLLAIGDAFHFHSSKFLIYIYISAVAWEHNFTFVLLLIFLCGVKKKNYVA